MSSSYPFLGAPSCLATIRSISIDIIRWYKILIATVKCFKALGTLWYYQERREED